MDALKLESSLSEHGIALPPDGLRQFEEYFDLLVEWNGKMNLTGITEKDEVYLKHFYDSLTPAFHFSFSSNHSLIDVGSGAGFPGIPLKICYPQLRLTIVDSLRKRINFLEQVVSQLQLQGVTLIHARAEDAGKDKNLRERFDVVTARAVARLSVLAEYCLPFAKVGGVFIAMKGSDISAELNEAKGALKVLGGKTERVESFPLPDDGGGRSIIFINKISPTPTAYPRKAGHPDKKSL